MNSPAKIALLGFIIIGILLGIRGGLIGERVAPSFTQLTVTAEVSGNTILVNGTTDLPDNTLLLITLSKDGLTIIEGKPIVSGGKYQTSLSKSLAPGTYIVYAFLTASDQDTEVLEKIGEFGENLAGETSYRGAHIFADYTFMKAKTEFVKHP